MEKTLKILWGAIALYIIFVGSIAILRHTHFETQAYDLGIFTQTFWNTLRGDIMQNTLEAIPNHLGVHMSPFLFLLVPGYALFPSPYFLLLIQTIALGLGAWPVYLIAKYLLRNPRWALAIALLYLFYFPLHSINLFEFHEIAFFIPLFLAAFYKALQKQWGWTSFFLVLAASTKEDAILAVLFFGIYLLCAPSEINQHNQKKIGVSIIICATLYLFLAVKILMPYFGGGLLHTYYYNQFGTTPKEIIITIFTQPLFTLSAIFTAQKMTYLFWLFAPVAFLPFLSWRSLILLIPGLAENLLANHAPQFSSLYHYDALLVSGIFIGAIYGIKTLMDRRPFASLQWILIGAMGITFLIRSPLTLFHFPVTLFQTNQEQVILNSIVDTLPPQASVSSFTRLVPHLANRKKIYLLGLEPEAPDFVIIDGSDLSGFANPEVFQAYADNYVLSKHYQFQEIGNRYFILKK